MSADWRGHFALIAAVCPTTPGTAPAGGERGGGDAPQEPPAHLTHRRRDRHARQRIDADVQGHRLMRRRADYLLIE